MISVEFGSIEKKKYKMESNTNLNFDVYYIGIIVPGLVEYTIILLPTQFSLEGCACVVLRLGWAYRVL